MIKDSQSERHFTTYTWYFLSIMTFYSFIKDGIISPSFSNITKDILFLGIFAIINLIRKNMIDFGVYEVDYFYLRSRLIEFFLICFGFFYMGISPWVASFILGAIILITILEGKKIALHTIIACLIITIVFLGLNIGMTQKRGSEYLTYLFIIISGFAIWQVAARITNDNKFELQKIITESQLVTNQKDEMLKLSKEFEGKFEKAREKLRFLEQQNEELRDSLEKYYEFHHISSVISSIFDINGLLKFINETILEIIEANYSSIFLFEPKRGSLLLEVTNITDEDNIKRLKDNINNDIIFDIIENGTPYVINFDEYSGHEFNSGRGIKSFVCLPISTPKKKYGIVLIECLEYNKFNEENQKLSTLIGYQLSTAMENLELYKRMKQLATIDGLTGVYNRLYFRERLSKELKIAAENDFPLSLVILDIDHFKLVNDTYSHLIGDKVLKVLTTVVKNSIRRSDMIARYGGEEFTILFPNMDANRAAEVCESLRKKISEAQISTNDKTFNITASFGIANYPDNAFSEENLVKAADRALYEAKDSGRNNVKISKEKLV